MAHEGRAYAIAIDIGGTNVKAGVLDREGRILARRRALTEERQGGAQLMAKLVDLAQALIADTAAATERYAGIGVGTPGLPKDGVIASCPGKIPGWEGTAVCQQLTEATGLPAAMDNDVKVIALGEGWTGAAKGERHFVSIALGTGVGGGLIMDGRVYQGEHGVSARLGHMIVEPNGKLCMCGNRGCLEAYCSGPSIAASAIDHVLRGCDTILLDLAGGDIRAIEAKTVIDAAKQGDPIAREVIGQAARRLATAVVSLMHALNPKCVVIGGGVAAAGGLLMDPLRAFVSQHAWLGPGETVDIRLSTLGDDAGLYGGAALAFALSQE